jgi:ABC-type nickel/cobalt efflux system permease component RcnA
LEDGVMSYGPTKNPIWLGMLASASALLMGLCLCTFILFVFSPSPTRHGLIVVAVVLAVVGSIVLPLTFPRFNLWRIVTLFRWRRRRGRDHKTHQAHWPRKVGQPATVPGEVFLPDRKYKHVSPKDSVFVPFHDPRDQGRD